MKHPPFPKPCASYAAGHTVHWIQALHVANKAEVRARTRSGELIAVEGNQLTVDLDDGRRVELLNHETDRLLALAPAVPFPVRWNEQYALLSLPTGHLLSAHLANAGPLRPCQFGGQELPRG
jgi:hypothetical protein